MSAAQLTLPRIRFDYRPRTALRLARVETILHEERVMDPVPCRMTLIGWIEDGTLEGKKTEMGFWIVYEDSLDAFVRKLQPAAA